MHRRYYGHRLKLTIEIWYRAEFYKSYFKFNDQKSGCLVDNIGTDIIQRLKFGIARTVILLYGKITLRLKLLLYGKITSPLYGYYFTAKFTRSCVPPSNNFRWSNVRFRRSMTADRPLFRGLQSRLEGYHLDSRELINNYLV